MAKFYGKIGYMKTVDDGSGVWNESYVERPYYGDIIRNTFRYSSNEYVNDDVTISNEISVISDNFAVENFHLMRYVEFMGAKWRIANVEFEYPRIKLTLGGVYNAS